MIEKRRKSHGWKPLGVALVVMALGLGASGAVAGAAADRGAPTDSPTSDPTADTQPGATATAPSAEKRHAQDMRTIVHEGHVAAGESGLAIGRDPFKLPEALQRRQAGDFPVTGPLPPGVRGLLIHTLKLEGTAREDATAQMIAVVTNGTNLAYFLRENQEVYDGRVDKITGNMVDFKQKYYDAEGALRFRDVVLRLGPAAGEAR